ncbi:MAG: hypothetical protein AB1796_06105, partial [Bacillota bacterium]
YIFKDLKTKILRSDPSYTRPKNCPVSIKKGDYCSIKESDSKQLTEQSHVLSRLRSKGYLDSVLFIEQSNLITKQLHEAKKQRSKLFEYNGFNDEAARTEELIAFLKKQDDLIESFDEDIFSLMVERIIVKSKLEIAFRLINGLELPEIIGEEVG